MDEFGCDYECKTVGESIIKYNIPNDWSAEFDAYDDVYSIQYFGQNLRPYWNRNENETIFTQLEKAKAEYKSLLARCAAFDYQLITDAAKVGGKKYAELCALAYRQVMAAHKLVESPQGELLYLSKENFSNGSINTVDLTYPSCPMYLLYNPELQKGMMNGIFYYSESGKGPKPFAAHDLGTYPLANGQTYGGDMPVEEYLCAAPEITFENVSYRYENGRNILSIRKTLRS